MLLLAKKYLLDGYRYGFVLIGYRQKLLSKPFIADGAEDGADLRRLAPVTGRFSGTWFRLDFRHGGSLSTDGVLLYREFLAERFNSQQVRAGEVGRKIVAHWRD